MILTCPECATRYQADASQFAPDGRKVRCAKCGHVWHQAAPQPEPEADLEDVSIAPEEPEAEPVAQPTREAYAPPPTPRVEPKPAAVSSRFSARPPLLERLGFGVGWAVLAAMVFVIGWAGLHYRQSIANLWPQSSSLYAAVGMPVNTRGIEIKSGDKDAHFETENGQDVLVITGDVVNITSRELSVPPIRVSLTDADKRELYHWTFAPGVTTLNPGKSAPFRTRLPTPPVAVRHIELRFAAERVN